MEGNKYFPNFLGEVRRGIYYISPLQSLKVDKDLKTIWIDLETPKDLFVKKTPKGGFNFQVYRVALGTANDFKININTKFLELIEVFKNQSIPIPQIVSFILNPQMLGENNQQIIEHIMRKLSQFSEDEKKEMIKFAQSLSNIPQESLDILISSPRYSLLFGNLTNQEQAENVTYSRKNEDLKKQNISKKDIEDCFGGLVLSKRIYSELNATLGIEDILGDPPKRPNTGGAIFIDEGGTGKSLMKAALLKFWKKMGGTAIEKNGIAEFSAGTNYATLINSWYFGYDKGDNEGYDKEGLFNQAIDNKVPSLLIIDEADRFVKSSSSDRYGVDEAAEAIITEFKRYLTSREKGGVLGYVITIFIANVDEKDLNPQLSMGGERLGVLYFGPPTKKTEWLGLINISLENLTFSNRSKKTDEILAELLLEHNKNMPHEKFMISPRKFGKKFCEAYSKKYLNEEIDDDEEMTPENVHNILHSKTKKSSIQIDFNIFVKHFIDDELAREIKLSGIHNGNELMAKYYQIAGLTATNENDERTNKLDPDVSELLKDPDVQRIISAREANKVLSSMILPQHEYKDIYRKLAAKYHPDKHENKSDGCQELAELLFKKASDAYDCLINQGSQFDPQLYNFSKFVQK